MSERKDSIKATTKHENLWLHETVFCAAFALFLGLCVWMTDPSSPLESKSSDAENSYYNLLVQGFSEGHLYVKRDAPAALAQLANPYDPTANLAYISGLGDMSYYKGHLYLYFGVTPALVLLWPWHVLTRHYLTDGAAIAILFAAGFAIALALMRAVRRRYFPEVNIWTLTASILAFGLALGLTPEDTINNVSQIAITSGFTFAMLTLAATWCALHSCQTRRIFWMLLASFAYGLAVGSRPSLLFGIIILLIPVAQARHEVVEPGTRRRIGLLFAATVGPAMLVGLGLMLYNDLRFDNPFEFGLSYTLTGACDQTKAHQFSPHYLWFDFRANFLEPFGWTANFPFLQGIRLPPHPLGYFTGAFDAYGGIFTRYPLVLLAFAVPWAWTGRPPAAASPLRWFVAAAFLLFLTSAFTLCFYYLFSDRFWLDFLPPLMLISVVGFLGLARITLRSRLYGPLVHWAWCLLLGYSVTLSILSNIESHAEADCRAGKDFFFEYRLDEALAQYHKAEALWPDCADAHCGVGNILVEKGEIQNGIAEYQKALEIRSDDTEADNNLGYTLIRLGRVSDAIVYFQRTLQFEESYEARSRAYYNLGYAFELDGMAAKAADCYQKAIQLQPQFIQAQISLAWILATWPEASLRNGSQAVALMEKANQLSSGKDPKVLRTLAAAYAEAGQFDDAIATAQEAIALARQNGETNVLEKNEGFLNFYLKHQPYHQSRASAGN
jgi:tetratricopeptide (TPR) repeat protein